MIRFFAALIIGAVAYVPIAFVLSLVIGTPGVAAFLAVFGAIAVTAVMLTLLLRPSEPVDCDSSDAPGGAAALLAVGALTGFAAKQLAQEKRDYQIEHPFESLMNPLHAPHPVADAVLDAGASAVSGVIDLLDD